MSRPKRKDCLVCKGTGKVEVVIEEETGHILETHDASGCQNGPISIVECFDCESRYECFDCESRYQVEFEGYEVELLRGKDGRMIIQIDTDGEEESPLGPQCRVRMNDCCIYSNGEVGDDLDLPDDYPETEEG
jgi:hypothetical protein